MLASLTALHAGTICDASPYVAAGAKIIGDIDIGDECVIGANAAVIADVPGRSVVVGVPARVIKTDIDIRTFFSKHRLFMLITATR